jgi:hypothetical protein
MMEKRLKPNECPMCGGASVVKYCGPDYKTYSCHDCKTTWKSYKVKRHKDVDLLSGQPLQTDNG